MPHKYTPEQAQFIKDNIAGRSRKGMTALFNARFGLGLSVGQVTGFIKNHKFKNGLNGQFPKGHIPANKGTKGVQHGGEATQFKPGQMPHNYKPIGAERVNSDGYVDIKIQDGQARKNWKGKHILIWEAAHGPLPKGHAVIFGDGNKRNFGLSNLLLVSRAQLARLNQNHLIQSDADLTRTGIIIADIQSKIGERKKRAKATRRVR